MTALLVVLAALLATGCGGGAAGRPKTEPADASRPRPAVRLDRPAAPPAPPAPAGRTPAGAVAARPQRYYRLQPGQTIYSLARQHGVPVDQVLSANGIDDPHHLPVGTVIYIPDLPGATAPATAPAPAPALMSVAWPIEGLITGRFGTRGRHSHHDGIDIDGDKGDLIHAVAAGRVVRAGDEGAYGRTVIIDHGDGIATLYAHASRIRVDEGDEVQQDQVIAEVGRTGNARGTHLHFEVRRNGRPVDPLPLLRSGVVEAAR